MSTMTDKRTKGRRPADTLASRLILLRHDAGLSQRDASAKSGVPIGTWQGMELGRSTRNLAEHIDRIATAFGYDREWLMWGSRADNRCTLPSRSVASSSLVNSLWPPV